MLSENPADIQHLSRLSLSHGPVPLCLHPPCPLNGGCRQSARAAVRAGSKGPEAPSPPPFGPAQRKGKWAGSTILHLCDRPAQNPCEVEVSLTYRERKGPIQKSGSLPTATSQRVGPGFHSLHLSPPLPTPPAGSELTFSPFVLG